MSAMLVMKRKVPVVYKISSVRFLLLKLLRGSFMKEVDSSTIGVSVF